MVATPIFPAVMTYATVGFSTPNVIRTSGTVIIIQPDLEDTRAGLANPSTQPLSQWYRRWAWFFTTAANNVVKTLTETVTISEALAIRRNKIRDLWRR